MKLEYYHGHQWEEHFIKAAKDTVFKIYQEYAPPKDEAVSHHMANDDEDELAEHIMKRPRLSAQEAQQQQAESTELGRYLASGPLEWDIDVLDWWKVCIIMLHLTLIHVSLLCKSPTL